MDEMFDKCTFGWRKYGVMWHVHMFWNWKQNVPVGHVTAFFVQFNWLVFDFYYILR